MKKMYWEDYPVLLVDEHIKNLMVKEDTFQPIYVYEAGIKGSFMECANWVAERLIEGEVGIYNNTRIVVNLTQKEEK